MSGNSSISPIKDVVERNVHESCSNAPAGNERGASHLFAAAGQCDLALVMELIATGENVNSIALKKYIKYNGVTPLHAAISWNPIIGFEKRKPVIEFLVSNGPDLSALTSDGSPIWTLCPREEPDLTMLLINLGMSLNQRCPLTGKKVLHYWATNYGSPLNREAFPVLELLLAKGADLKAIDNFGLTPLNVAAIGSASIDFRGYPNVPALRCLLLQDEISVSDKISALELAGAMILLAEESPKSFISLAFKFWNEALDLRESVGLIPKDVMDFSINNIPWRASEWTTRDDLEEIQYYRPSFDNPYFNISFQNRKKQAILVSRRILSGISSKAFVHHLLGMVPDENHWSLHDFHDVQALDVCWALLEGVRCITDPGAEDLWIMVAQINSCLVSTLRKLQSKQSPILNSNLVELSMQLVFDTNKSPFAIDQEDRRVFSSLQTVEPLETIYILIILLSENQAMLNNEMKSCLHQFIKRDDRDDFGRNLLLLACDQNPDARITLVIIRLLLEVGADATVKNDKGDTPLHLVCAQLYDSPSAADLLFAYGAQPDQRNLKGETPLDVWKATQRNHPERLAPMWATNTVLPLSFWCARSLRRSKIPLDKLPITLRKFVLQPN